MPSSVFHHGEQVVQERAGVSEIAQWAQVAIRPFMPDQHREFYTALPFLVAAARDDQGRPWATLLTGPDGFITTPNDRTLRIATTLVEGDALSSVFDQSGADIGLLGIDFASRRRNRANGRVGRARDGTPVVHVDQTFGNCPQYIRARQWRRAKAQAPLVERRSDLTADQQTWIRNADTLFIASGYRGEGENAAFGMDASHRGGERGFVTVFDAQTIGLPDFAGNHFFNTIGNLIANPQVGVLFVDFQTGSLLQMTGRAEIQWNEGSSVQRFIRIHIDDVVQLTGALALRWTGDATAVRDLRLLRRTQESEDVTSFHFAARDGGPLPAFIAGQHLPIELRSNQWSEPVRRTYSLSGVPKGDGYRISVKREPNGTASRYLHDHLQEGDLIVGQAPAGHFVLPPGETPVVLISAGIGITPLLSMLHTLAEATCTRPVAFLHGARNGAHHPFSEEVDALVAHRPGIERYVVYSQPRATDVGHDAVGRIDDSILKRFVRPDADYLVCGPPSFMAQVTLALRAQGVAESRIHSESFGPRG